jgi:vacuolar-type H+-ATPase subunit I/STV1
MGTYLTWQTVVAVLTVISMGFNVYRAKKGANKDEMTYFRDEVLRQFKTLNEKVDEVQDDVENTTQRLESHIDRQGEKPKSRSRKVSE